jgi:hypothetical protein
VFLSAWSPGVSKTDGYAEGRKEVKLKGKVNMKILSIFGRRQG